MAATDLKLRPVNDGASGSRPLPSASILRPWIFDYAPSPDGKDVNLLIMLHGLARIGDNKAPFAQLGKSLNLPCTAVLSLQGPLVVPLMESPTYFSWYNTFDPLFNPLPSPDPSPTLKPLRQLLETLTSAEIGWDLAQIHLFGWGQGGSMALELALSVGKDGIPSPAGVGDKRKRLGSVTSVCGPLLSFPASTLGIATPIAYFTRQSASSAAGQKVRKAIERAFKEVEIVQGQQGGGEAMPRGREEWKGIMMFWGEMLGRDEGWKGSGEVFEVVR
ncbi:uncharacterized protein MKK02DRAFT_36495 [Dioszegia hungarica]|uniref:Phospholipase/carboxylesterase/thioesterase domain-containing protein n=1 Tax=Dioszegia hungarica TaxID=4972 RepID=A0AA38LWF4_9TREE|nr:uncharacterized protein MKK02DRAFT_36495 [Dioszegia hungarica]KAI9637618.1 hypothetical protein MKK02DRAFT_36495 [Dioszegia hungarica]